MPALDVVGRFPPPLDGQAIATARLADLLASPLGGAFDVGRHDVGAPEGERLVVGGAARLRRVGHYVGLPVALRRALGARPEAPVLWPSVSPSKMGHWRDLATVVPAFGRRPVVGVVHVGDFDRVFRSAATAPTARALVRRLRALVFLTDGLAGRCAEWVPDGKRWVVPNTIDAAAIPDAATVEAARQRRAARPGVRVLFLSGMIPSKGYPAVLGALAALRERGRDATARFVGRWPSPGAEAAFRARIDALGLADRAEVVGGVGRDEVGALILDADVFALPTTYPVEAQPLTVIEALAAGTPVVVTRWAGLPEMVAEPAGRFVAAHAPAEVADAVEALCGDGWAEASRAARARFERQFSPEAVGRRWQDVLGRLG